MRSLVGAMDVCMPLNLFDYYAEKKKEVVESREAK